MSDTPTRPVNPQDSAPAEAAVRTLSEVAVGQSAVIRAIRCDRSIALRLMEMGMLPGTRVNVARVAPMGDPIELRLRNYSLSIRFAEARAIDVTP